MENIVKIEYKLPKLISFYSDSAFGGTVCAIGNTNPAGICAMGASPAPADSTDCIEGISAADDCGSGTTAAYACGGPGTTPSANCGGGSTITV
ncbi:MAG: hypothetical protein HQ564_06230 [Candidatus Saganbacteria bacterium]|nr:hypothetical protein [Candidatus Saganbacteria bacterium]